ncbi:MULTISPECIES: zinc-binding dehydrogenase [Actinomyces]|nr:MULTISPECIES: zinc-binding dehydrogenase [Actinomyces]
MSSSDTSSTPSSTTAGTSGQDTAPATMLAARLSEPGSVENLQVTELAVPDPPQGWVRLKVMAFGLNRSEYHSVTGLAEGMTFPRILGIEATGIVDLDPSGELAPGTQAAALMGGMGRQFDGGYAQYVVVPRSQLLTFRSDLPWEIIGAVPETLQTAYGSLTTGLDLRPGQTLLVRGGTSALGLAAAALALEKGCRVLATSRRQEGLDLLASRGVTPLLDDGAVASRARELAPQGVDAALELVGVPTLRDSLEATAVHGTVCFSGMLSDSWTIPDFYPLDWIPFGVRLTTYSGGAESLPQGELQRVLDAIATGSLDLLPIHPYPLSRIQDAHRAIVAGTHIGKLVGLPWA